MLSFEKKNFSDISDRHGKRSCLGWVNRVKGQNGLGQKTCHFKLAKNGSAQSSCGWVESTHIFHFKKKKGQIFRENESNQSLHLIV